MMRHPIPGVAMITTTQAVSREVNLRVGGHRRRYQAGHPGVDSGLVAVYRAEGPCPASTPRRSSSPAGVVRHIVPERSDEPFTGLERHLATTFARD